MPSMLRETREVAKRSQAVLFLFVLYNTNNQSFLYYIFCDGWQENLTWSFIIIRFQSINSWHKKQIDTKETEVAIENKQQQLGEDPNPEASNNKHDDKTSLLSIVKNMSVEQRRKIIESLKQNGLGDPLTKENLVQNAFTVEKTIRENS